MTDSNSGKRPAGDQEVKAAVRDAYQDVLEEHAAVTPRVAMKIMWDLEKSVNLDMKTVSSKLSAMAPDR